MSENKSLKKNFFYNFSLNIINIIFPLIIAPYVSRILGADNLGKYNFSASFSNFFLVFATFGTTTYGIREIAKVRDDKTRLDKTFSEIFLMNFIATAITLIIYIIVIFISPKTNKDILLFLISAMSIFMNLFCIDWFYIGIEEFKLIAIRSLIIKIICIIGILIFVRVRNSYNIYAFLNVIAFSVANLFNFIYSKKFVTLKFKEINIKEHFNVIVIFFYSNVVVSIYTLFDQVLLGFFSTDIDVAFYNRTKQIYTIALTITLSISTILLPKLTHLLKKDFVSYKKLLRKSIDYIYIFSVPSVFGIAVLSKDMMLFLGGYEFQEAYISLMIISILVFVVPLGTWMYNQLFLPLGKEKVGLKTQIFMAIISVVSNMILIRKYGYIGASISLVLAEVSGTIYAVFYAKSKINEVKIKYITNSLLKYIFSSLFMTISIVLFKLLNYYCVTNILFGIIGGAIIYFGILYLIKDEICREFSDYIFNKIKKVSSIHCRTK